MTDKFLSAPSARRATPMSRSICARRSKFLSTPSARRATEDDESLRKRVQEFLSTPSARRATCPLEPACADTCISIHALREEGDRNRCFRADRSADFYPRPPRGGRPDQHGERLRRTTNFYPHPPRGGRRLPGIAVGGELTGFLSTPSARRATPQNPAPTSSRCYFYPHPPRGGRLTMCGIR